MDEADHRAGLARAGGHREQQAALAGSDRLLDGVDRADLVVAQAERLLDDVGRLVAQLLIGRGRIVSEHRGRHLRRVPAEQRPRVVGGAADVLEPDAALGLELAEVWAAVGRVEERHLVARRRVLEARCPARRGG
ncbi:MAG: hypothetical protein ACREBE_05565, partial [bacterium]